MMTRIMRFPCLLLAGLLVGPLVFAQRQTTELSTDWRFVRRDVGAQAPVDAQWATVQVPHTWNAADAQNGLAADPGERDGYYRGAGWYERALPLPAMLTGKRVFVRFEAVSTVADVYVNGHHLGQHRGAFGAFCFEITPYVCAGGPNTLRVRADNSRFPDVAPLQGDFSLFGGVYRPVTVLVTDAVCLSPLDYGSPGVELRVDRLDTAQAELTVGVRLSSGLPVATPVEVEVAVADATGRVVVTQRQPVALAAAENTRVALRVVVPQPHRWQGRADPYLYAAQIRVLREGRVVDEMAQPLGLRTIAITQEQGVLLNGQPYPIHGVNRHQDRLDKGWALAPADHDEDFRLMVEMGVTAVRFAHYQQSEYVHQLCDRLGLLVWEEIPLVDRLSGLPQFAANARQQLTELILQNGNHPSVGFWGLFNELNAVWAEQPGPEPAALIAELRQYARQLDATRPLVAASWLREPSPLHTLPEWIAFNVYPGWYWGTPEDFQPLVAQLSDSLGGQRLGISEYGAGASVRQHQEGVLTPPASTGTRFHPEEWQTELHERLWAQMRGNPRLWGTFIWNMFDFAVDKRDEGDTPGRNDKGLVTYDRQTRKEAFYFYQANWTEVPMVHVVARRLTPRRQARTEVKVYSNCAEVELFLNGQSLGAVRPDVVRIARWPSVTLRAGENVLRAVARGAGHEVTDHVQWILTPGVPAAP